QKAMEKIARATFWALDCRDVARVDMRMDADGRIYVLEVNPLPGLTPGYSDLVLIAQAVGMEYDQLIAEIMVGGLRRMREKRREERELEREREAKEAKEAKAAEVAKLAEKAERADKGEKRRPPKPIDARAQAGANGASNGGAASAGGSSAHAEGGNGNGSNGGANGNGANGNGANGNGGGGTVRAPVRREKSEPVRRDALDADSDSVPMPAAAGSTTTH
ncbi:MAG TPA: hypothetical protein VN253_11960, partial [Kofleriaceae bacterium]|nr:hypothetical protein [Kofleriaceae bacterium]